MNENASDVAFERASKRVSVNELMNMMTKLAFDIPSAKDTD